MELPARGESGRPQQRFMDEVKKDMQVVGVSEEDDDDGDRVR